MSGQAFALESCWLLISLLNGRCAFGFRLLDTDTTGAIVLERDSINKCSVKNSEICPCFGQRVDTSICGCQLLTFLNVSPD